MNVFSKNPKGLRPFYRICPFGWIAHVVLFGLAIIFLVGFFPLPVHACDCFASDDFYSGYSYAPPAYYFSPPAVYYAPAVYYTPPVYYAPSYPVQVYDLPPVYYQTPVVTVPTYQAYYAPRVVVQRTYRVIHQPAVVSAQSYFSGSAYYYN